MKLVRAIDIKERTSPMQNWTRWKNIMKCVPFEEKRLSKWQPPYICQPKYDGVRCRAVRTETGFILLSSEENLIFSVPHLNELLDKIANLPNELDGELYCHGMSFEDIVSITSRTVNLHPDHKRIQYHVFDVVNSDPQFRRTVAIEQLHGLSPWLAVSPYYLCDDLEGVLRAYDLIIEKGYEGIIVRHHANIYERKRSTLVMKFKPKKEDDYEILGTQEEIDKEGEPKGSLGALVCRSGDGNLFCVGTGFSAEQRQILWEIRDQLPGRIAKVKYQHITVGRAVPRFPVFVELT